MHVPQSRYLLKLISDRGLVGFVEIEGIRSAAVEIGSRRKDFRDLSRLVDLAREGQQKTVLIAASNLHDIRFLTLVFTTDIQSYG